jgi:hypothetical protein
LAALSSVVFTQTATLLGTTGPSVPVVPNASVSITNKATSAKRNGGTNIGFNGRREEQNVWMIDSGENYDRSCGGSVTIMPSVSAIPEFNTITSKADGDFGIGSGGTINVAIKSGTRGFHGEALKYFRNDAIDANNYFSKEIGQPPPDLRYNILGWNLGGPVFIPGLYNRERKKTFFFAAVPRAQRNGGFSGLNTTIRVPTTGDAAQNAAFAALGLTPGQPLIDLMLRCFCFGFHASVRREKSRLLW